MTTSDLRTTTARKKSHQDKGWLEATYLYNGGAIRKKKYRRTNGSKYCTWEHMNTSGSWNSGRNGIEPGLYGVNGPLPNVVYLVEGEKDCDTIQSLSCAAVSLPDGAESKWRTEYSVLLKDHEIIIIPDNDQAGHKLAARCAGKLVDVAASVRVFDLKQVWPEIPEKSDITDFYEAKGAASTIAALQAAQNAPEWSMKPSEGQGEDWKDYEWVLGRLNEIDPANNDLYSTTDDVALARLFAETFKDRARYNVVSKSWFVYNGVVWGDDSQGMMVDLWAKTLQRALLRYCGDSAVGSTGFTAACVKLGATTARKRMIEDARSFYPVKNTDFDSQPHLLNTLNTVIDLRDGSMIEHNPDLLLSRCCGCEYNPEADGSIVRQFVNEIMSGDDAKAEYLQQVFGYSLTGVAEQEQLYILYGSTTRNGKSTLCDTFEHLMGSYGAHIQPETLAVKDRNSRNASGDIARLEGVRFLHSSEPPKRMQFDVALLKSLTGRDTITARELYQSEREFQPVFKLVINTNYLPVVSDDTVFSSGRIKVISFDRHFTEAEQDTRLKSKLREPDNLSALLNWALEGLALYREHGNRLLTPGCVEEATLAYRKQSDRIGCFLEECCVQDPKAVTTIKVLYQYYDLWCQACGYHPMSKSSFIEELKTKRLWRPTKYVDNNTARNVVVGWKPDATENGCIPRVFLA